MNTTTSLSAIVLAGGQSSRMGRDKALIPLQGVPLLRRVCEVALNCASEVYVVTFWPERYQDILSDGCRFIQEVLCLENKEQGTGNGEQGKNDFHDFVVYEVQGALSGEIENREPSAEQISHGPLVGFAQGLAQVNTDWVLLLACDLPQLQVKVLQDWAQELDNAQPEVIALLPRQSQGWEPLCGFYRRQCLPFLTDFIKTGGRSFQRWLAQHPVQELPVSDTQLFFNCNTPADLEDLFKSK